MSADGLSDDYIRGLLQRANTFAVVGASANPDRPSHGVMAALARHGYSVLPVNPGLAGQKIAGLQVYAALDACPAPVDIVDVFRNSISAADAVHDAVRLKDKLAIAAVWMQLGVINHDAAAFARTAGLLVVMDRCPKIEIARLGLAPRTPR